MGIVWEASQKGVPFLGVPGNSLKKTTFLFAIPIFRAVVIYIVVGRVSTDQGIGKDVPLPTYPYGKSLCKPYIVGIYRLYSPRIPRLNTINTMVVHVR